MKQKVLMLPLTLFAIMSLSLNTAFAQNHIRGNGNITSANREIGAFNDLELSGSYHVYISQGSQPSLKIETDENLMPYIITEVHGNKLEIKSKEHVSINPSKEVDVYLTVAQLKKMGVSGSSKIETKNTLSGDDLRIDISGSSDLDLDLKVNSLVTHMSGASKVKLSGSANSAEYNTSGSSNVKADDMVSDDTQINVSGSGKLNVYAQKNLNVNISGMGDVTYKGHPAVTQAVSGMGHVRSE